MIIRQNYLDQLIAYKDRPVIKIITGMRRCGKSTIMALYKDYLLSSGINPENIISMSLEMMEFDDITDYRQMYKLIKAKIPASSPTYLLLDEIQMIPGWEKAIDSLYAEGVADIYLTGSNSNLLSSEIATLLSGRYVIIKILPLSFQEYLLFVLERKQREEHQYNSLRRSLRKDLDQENNIALDIKRYIRFGGLPMIPFLPQERSMVITYLEGVYNIVVVKDILTNRGIDNIQALKKIIRYVASNTGKVLSPQIISEYFLNKYQSDSFAYKEVALYMELLEKAYIFYPEDCYDLQQEAMLIDECRYYIADTGVRNTLLLFSDTGKGHNLETIVYFELLRRGYTVFWGKYGDCEIDFYAVRQERKICIQIAVNLKEEEIWKKKIQDLQTVPDCYQKYIIAMNRFYEEQIPSVKFINLPDFLLKQDYEFAED